MNALIASSRSRGSGNPTSPTQHTVFRHRKAVWLGVWLVAGAMLFSTRSAPAQDMKPETLRRCKKAAVMVWTAESKREKADTKLGSGSGAFINSTGLLFTNNHVVDPVSNLPKAQHDQWHYEHNKLTWQVITDAGTEDEKTWEAVVLYQNKPTDLAVLQAYNEDGEKLVTPDFLRFLPESRLEERMKLWALGFPGGDSQKTNRDKAPEVTVTDGHIIEIPRSPAGRIPIIYTDILARPGNSGGATVNADGLLVGVVTRLAEPEGRISIGGMKKTGLVPSKRVRQMVLTTIILGKILEGTDYTPFVELLTDENGQLNIPEYQRLSDQDVLFFEDGDRIYGDIESGTITWDLRIGQLNVPTSAVAYVLNNKEGSHLFLEGGNRVFTPEADSTFEFAPKGGTSTTVNFDELQAVAFRKSGRKLAPVNGKIVVVDTELSHLRVSDVHGTVKFEGRIGYVDVKLEDIKGIDRSEDDRQIVMLRDGRRMTGKFAEGTYQATIVGTSTPIEFGLGEVKEARIVIEMYRPDAMAGLGLPGILASADRNVTRIVKSLESGDAGGARTKVEAMLASDSFKKLPDVKKDQVRLLAAVAALRDSDAEAAPKLFRKCLRAEDENIGIYAGACSAVLKRFDDFKFRNKPLSDRATFVAAGTVVADDSIQQVRDILKDARNLQGERRAEYVRGINDVKKFENHMKMAAVFRGTEAEDELFRLWRFATTLCEREIRRIDNEIKEKKSKDRKERKKRSGRRKGKSGRNTQQQRDLDKLQELREEAIETFWFYETKLRDSGYRIEDPDIQKQKEREDDDEGDPDEGP